MGCRSGSLPPSGQPASTFPLHQGLERLPQQGTALQISAQLLGLAQKAVIEGHRGAHIQTSSRINLDINRCPQQ